MSHKNESNSDRKGPLDKIKVLDFTRILAGPYSTMVLADQGAEVIKIESPGGGDETRNFAPFQGELSHYFMALNRNKKSLVLNLQSEEGQKIAHELASQADIVIENFRPGVMDKFGLSYESLSKNNPELIYCSISGFGIDGPLRDQPAFDIVAQALSGVMSVNGEPNCKPTKLGLPMGDLVGGINATTGILCALHERSETGKGKHIDISMLDGLLGLLGYLAQLYFIDNVAPKPTGSKHQNIVPYGAFKTRDGYIIIACLTESFWGNLARAIERDDLVNDPRFADNKSRVANRDELDELLEKSTILRTTSEWELRLKEFDVPHSPVLSIAEALEHPNTVARGMVTTTTHPEAGEIRMVNNPINYIGTERPPISPPPLLGEDTNEILQNLLGYSMQDITDVRARGVVE